MMTEPKDIVLETHLKEVPLFRRGKVRDVYDLGKNLLIVASDRISAFDCVCPNGISYKGEVLTRISLFWFSLLSDVIPHHLITARVEEYPAVLKPYRDILKGRSMLVKKTKVFPIECVVRGYLAGSGWKEYQKTQTVCGEKLPEGLKESSELAQPIFTPATKAEEGHDENISFGKMAEIIGQKDADYLKSKSLRLYTKARDYARSRGIIIDDTKFEFGRDPDGVITLIDEVLTPDSSRFWPKDTYKPGSSQPNFDKQFVRDYLDSLDWDKNPPAPALPPDVVRKTSERYLEAFELLTGEKIRDHF